MFGQPKNSCCKVDPIDKPANGTLTVSMPPVSPGNSDRPAQHCAEQGRGTSVEERRESLMHKFWAGLLHWPRRQVYKLLGWGGHPPGIDRKILDLLPDSVAHRARLIPVGGDKDHLILLCKEPLSADQKKTLELFVPHCRFTFADPEQYPEIYSRFDALITEYYPVREDPQFLYIDHPDQSGEAPITPSGSRTGPPA